MAVPLPNAVAYAIQRALWAQMGVYVKRTLSIVNYLLFLILIFASYVFFQSPVILTLFTILLILPLLSCFITRYAFSHITVRMNDKPYYTKKGVSSSVTFHINNPLPIPIPSCTISFLRTNRFYPNLETECISFPLYAMETQIIALPIESFYAGIVEIHLKEFIVFDYFNFFTIKKALDQNTEVMVTPHSDIPVLLDENIGAYGDEDTNENPDKGENPSEIKNIREYQIGDRLQSIHWKLTTKKSALMVKEYESFASRQQILLFELSKDDSVLLDPILDVTHSLSQYLIKMNADWKLMWWSVGLQDFREMEIRTEEDLLATFRELFYESTYSNPFFAYEVFQQRETKCKQFIYVSKINKDLVGKELALYNDVSALLLNNDAIF